MKQKIFESEVGAIVLQISPAVREEGVMSQFTFRTTPPATYISPTADEMRDAAKKVGLKSFSKDLVADLCNLAAGGRITPPSGYRGEVMRRVEERLPAPDSNGSWSISVRKNGVKTSVRTKNRQEAIQAKTDEAMRYHGNVCDFLGSLEPASFGETPLEQAMACLKLLSKKEGGQGGGEAGEPLPIFSEENSKPEGIAEALRDAIEVLESLSPEEKAMLDPEEKGLSKLEVAEDMLGDKRLMIDISRQLDQLTKLQVRRQRKLEVDPAGEEVRTRPIRNLGELSKISKTAWGMRQENPTFFLYQAVTGQLPVRERVTRIEKKQSIFILVDGSGSMSGRRHWKATGVVMNRLKAVLAGDAEVFLSVFDTSMGNVSHAGTPEEAKELIKKFQANNFSGGGTDIASAVRAAHKYIEDLISKGAALYRPEIVVLTDDDTSVASLKKSELAGTRVHGFAMEVANKSLVDLARSTGGVGIDKF
ncbi:VWA domain-containing protein [Patescibacteria group bacterium]|nr:MAG: VWA domain-containing protein [Patescibacteria group bacterium]